ncbi:SDR family NAD(P)-dependent oxidoreductase [Pseudochryseolinea flava]|uniref:Daunorubicin C-13 ketoreductase n=1 Tax=Pseudochryseolinea flava TaxID=2059302 RepID=A0A364Y5L4_9BACT|nr:SDR family NAD(P)-dependent oxidoreductase [Pseudochryseolinea flava]RAW02159.1 daunorubicin C-13 ketoreductase [Pseudochryseolinea flava]
MARIFITGSADGLGQMSAQLLITQGHEVVLHARHAQRAREAEERIVGAVDVLVGDLSNLEQTKELARKANTLGTFDAVIHNAGVYQTTAEQIFSVNTLAPYILTSLMYTPKRLVYLTSGMHLQGRATLSSLKKDDIKRLTYSDSKLHVMMLTKAVARKWPAVFANAVDPGWVPTKMGGRNAPDDLQKGYETQSWLASSDDATVKVSGQYFHHQQARVYNAAADSVELQEQLLSTLADITGVPPLAAPTFYNHNLYH